LRAADLRAPFLAATLFFGAAFFAEDLRAGALFFALVGMMFFVADPQYANQTRIIFLKATVLSTETSSHVNEHSRTCFNIVHSTFNYRRQLVYVQ
jgi:hypothetical protein